MGVEEEFNFFQRTDWLGVSGIDIYLWYLGISYTHPPFHMNNLNLQCTWLQTLNRVKAPKLTRAVNLMNRYSNWITFQIDINGRAAAAWVFFNFVVVPTVHNSMINPCLFYYHLFRVITDTPSGVNVYSVWSAVGGKDWNLFLISYVSILLAKMVNSSSLYLWYNLFSSSYCRWNLASFGYGL